MIYYISSVSKLIPRIPAYRSKSDVRTEVSIRRNSSPAQCWNQDQQRLMICQDESLAANRAAEVAIPIHNWICIKGQAPLRLLVALVFRLGGLQL